MLKIISGFFTSPTEIYREHLANFEIRKNISTLI